MSGVSEKIKSKIKNKVGGALHLTHKEHSDEEHEVKAEHGGGHLKEFMHKIKTKTKKKISGGGHGRKHHRKEEEDGQCCEEGEDEEESEEEEEGEDIEAEVEEGGGVFESLSELLSGIQI